MPQPRHPATHPVLLVENDDDGREVMLELLALNGYAAVAVRSGEAAMKLLRAGFRPCVIVLELMVPGDGWSFRIEQLADPALAPIPVIGGATIRATQDHVDPALRVQHVMMKPFDLDALFTILDAYCEPVRAA
jgi:CheY-like chemotaxis protein